jgi:hypothetical protein
MLLLLIINMQRKEVFVHPLRFSMGINEEPFLGGAFLAALEGGVQVFRPTVVAQQQPNLGEDMLIILDQTIKIPE